MNTETSVKVNYVGFTRRILAEILDFLIFSPGFIFVVFMILGNKDFSQEFEQSLEAIIPAVGYIATSTLVLTVFKILMITKLGGTPGKLLCGMHIKDANTFTNATLMQATIRCISKGSIWIIFEYLHHLDYDDYILPYLLIVLILFLFAVFDQRKQAFYDRFAKTVVIDYKPS